MPDGARLYIDGAWITPLITRGQSEGAILIAGGPGRPEQLMVGHYAKPTVFAGVDNDMSIARQEIFGPVAAILAYETVDDAVVIANDTLFGLSAYVRGRDQAACRDIAARLRAGQVSINGAGGDFHAPFGGYRRSGNGREWGEAAFHEFLETKAVLGCNDAPA